MPNRLAQESSPYLLQHQNNPVDWYPWGEEALQRAKAEERPIFLSIGYSACHWCHVMEHESFESEQIAKSLNDRFVCIKVDREERPDLDQIYMTAVQLMTGRGGWPMSVFLTPQLKPFFGGTYWPPTARQGMPGFDQIIAAVDDAWQNRREQAIEQADQLTEHIQRVAAPSGQESWEGLEENLLTGAVAQLERMFDAKHGGFGGAPKFPHSMDLQLMLRVWRRHRREGLLQMVRLTLDKMAAGGIYDHLGGGFARYSTDARWLVPHFEKMLYDNALLVGAYLDAFQVTADANYSRTAQETCDYILDNMTDPLGGFYSTEDADSEGVEGKFYVWSPAEIKKVLGAERGERFCYLYDVTEEGNFEGESILNLPKSFAQAAALKQWDVEESKADMAAARRELLAVREQRIPPGKDDKVLVSWNGLMIDSLARAAGVLSKPAYLAAARKAADFLLKELRRKDGRLLHCWRGGVAKLDAYLDDYACLANGLISLYEACFEETYIEEAVKLADIMLKHFADRKQNGFFYTADDHEALIHRHKDFHDSSVPSGNAMAATVLLRLGKLCGRADYLTAARETLELAVDVMQKQPAAAGQMLIAADRYFGPVPEIAILGDASAEPTAGVLADLHRRYIPNRVLACRTREDAGEVHDIDPIFIGKAKLGEEPTVFLCQEFTCLSPVSGPAAARQLWQTLAFRAEGD